MKVSDLKHLDIIHDESTGYYRLYVNVFTEPFAEPAYKKGYIILGRNGGTNRGDTLYSIGNISSGEGYLLEQFRVVGNLMDFFFNLRGADQ